jgi:hypothetical protein
VDVSTRNLPNENVRQSAQKASHQETESDAPQTKLIDSVIPVNEGGASPPGSPLAGSLEANQIISKDGIVTSGRRHLMPGAHG